MSSQPREGAELGTSRPHCQEKTAHFVGGTLRSVALRTYSVVHKKRPRVLMVCDSPGLSVPPYYSYCPCPQARDLGEENGVLRALSSGPLVRRKKPGREKRVLPQSWQEIYGDGLFQKKRCRGRGRACENPGLKEPAEQESGHVALFHLLLS